PTNNNREASPRPRLLASAACSMSYAPQGSESSLAGASEPQPLQRYSEPLYFETLFQENDDVWQLSPHSRGYPGQSWRTSANHRGGTEVRGSAAWLKKLVEKSTSVLKLTGAKAYGCPRFYRRKARAETETGRMSASRPPLIPDRKEHPCSRILDTTSFWLRRLPRLFRVR